MAQDEPTAELDPRFSDPNATPTPWPKAREELKRAKAYWLSTVRPDGRPHVTTVAAVWVDDALHFTTGRTERKAKNLAENARCVITTGTNAFEGLDVVVEGEAVRVKILRCELAAGSGAPGQLLDDRLTVACGDGAIRILELQRAGKAPMKAADFLRGTPLKPPARLA